MDVIVTWSFCGDGIVDVGDGELCDDGNTLSGDGCSDICTYESWWSCTWSGTTVCDEICGDFMIVGAEQCDDGNVLDNDGCTASCVSEAVRRWWWSSASSQSIVESWARVFLLPGDNGIEESEKDIDDEEHASADDISESMPISSIKQQEREHASATLSQQQRNIFAYIAARNRSLQSLIALQNYLILQEIKNTQEAIVWEVEEVEKVKLVQQRVTPVTTPEHAVADELVEAVYGSVGIETSWTKTSANKASLMETLKKYHEQK